MSYSVNILCVCFLLCRGMVVFPDTLHTKRAHLGVQKRPGLHAQKWPLVNSQPRSQIPADCPQAALQSQCCVFLLQSVVCLVPNLSYSAF